FVFLDAPPPPRIYPLSLHDALPISSGARRDQLDHLGVVSRPSSLAPEASRSGRASEHLPDPRLVRRARHRSLQRQLHGRLFDDQDRKSTRLNSSHVAISYAVFCLKK